MYRSAPCYSKSDTAGISGPVGDPDRWSCMPLPRWQGATGL